MPLREKEGDVKGGTHTIFDRQNHAWSKRVALGEREKKCKNLNAIKPDI